MVVINHLDYSARTAENIVGTRVYILIECYSRIIDLFFFSYFKLTNIYLKMI